MPEQPPIPNGKEDHHNHNEQYPSDTPYDEVEQGMMTSNTKRKSHKDDNTGKCITSFIAEDASESDTADSDAGAVKIHEVEQAKKKEVAAEVTNENIDNGNTGGAAITIVGETNESPSASKEEFPAPADEMDDLD